MKFELHPTQAFNGEMETNEPLRVYDTSGPWGDDAQSCDSEQGLTPVRADWIQARGDTEEYEGREVQPQDNGYLTRGHEQYASRREKQKGRLEYFPGLEKKTASCKSGWVCHPDALCQTRDCYTRDGVYRHPGEFGKG